MFGRKKNRTVTLAFEGKLYMLRQGNQLIVTPTITLIGDVTTVVNTKPLPIKVVSIDM